LSRGLTKAIPRASNSASALTGWHGEPHERSGFHTDADKTVPAENSVLFYLALRKAGVPAEMHIYERGRHGMGLAQNDPVLSTWPDRLEDWLKNRGAIK
jgi:acetyl esterase/lipase